MASRGEMYVVVNPASGRGRGRRRMEWYRERLRDRVPGVVFGVSQAPGHEAELADEALAGGYRTLVAAGGDGTWGNVADRIVASGRTDVRMGLLPNGTGNDFGRSLGIEPADPAAAVEVLVEGHTRPVDVGRVETKSAAEHHPDRWESRHFLNLIGFGFDIAVIDAAAEARFLKGELLYKVTALQQLVRFPGFRAAVSDATSEPHLMLTVSNGRYFGGGFPIAPGAEPDDGRLHACSIGDAAPFTRLRLFNLAERGRHLESSHVQLRTETSFRLAFPAPPRFEMDGDVRQAADSVVEVRVLPGALNVLAPRR